MYADSAPAPNVADPYDEGYGASVQGAPPPAADSVPPPRPRSRSRSPHREGYRSPQYRPHRSPPPRRPAHAPVAPNPSNVLGVFGLSIRTQERDLEDEFSRFGRVEKVTIVYDQRQSDRSRGFGFIRMSTVEEATRCISELNGADLNGRRIRVDYSVTDRPHAPTPGEYMGHRRRDNNRDSYYRRDSRDRDRDYHRRDKDRYDRDRDYYGRDKDWRDRRSSPGRRYHSPEYRRRRSYSRSPPRGGSPRRDYDQAAPTTSASGDQPRWS